MHRSNRKKSGGLYNKLRKKRKGDFGTDFIPVKIGKENKTTTRMLGGSIKTRLLQTDKVNVLDKDKKESKVVKIITVKENNANPNFVRMNVITRGAVVETDLGLVKIVSRPGQEQILNGILIKKK